MGKKKLPEAYGEIDLNLLCDLTLANGISGHEKEVAGVFKDWVKDSVDRIEYDNLGSIVAIKEGKETGPRLMFAGHIDEIGFSQKY